MLKGQPVWVFQGQTTAAVSRETVDCSGQWNAVSVAVIASDASPSATLTIKGARASGAEYTALPDPSAVQAITASIPFDVVVGSAFVTAELSDVTGGSFTVVITPFVSPGPTRVNARVGL